MKNKAWYGFFGVMVLLFAVSCSFDPEYNLQGTWEASNYMRYIFDDGNYTVKEKQTDGTWKEESKGTFTADGKTLKLKQTSPTTEDEVSYLYVLSLDGKTLTFMGGVFIKTKE
ncbi:MAG: lipocalin family protein [Treponema sp.]|jgi:hypothetical protein|nr:lipocalin family protein [Treponema sp.]